MVKLPHRGEEAPDVLDIGDTTELLEAFAHRATGEVRPGLYVVGEVPVGATLRLQRVLVLTPRGTMLVTVYIESTDRPNPSHDDVERLGANLRVEADAEPEIHAGRVLDLHFREEERTYLVRA